jgi:predicted amidohydrolase YtcJ
VWRAAGLRQRIEHAQCLDPADVPRFAELGVAVSAQFTHAPSDEHLAKRFWADHLDGTYSFRSLVDSGAVVANGSDAPVEELDPWRASWPASSTTGGRISASPSSRRSTRRASHPRGSRTTSARAARSCPAATPTSSCLDRDPLACEPEELREVQVVATMLGGRWTHNPPPWD